MRDFCVFVFKMCCMLYQVNCLQLLHGFCVCIVSLAAKYIFSILLITACYIFMYSLIFLCSDVSNKPKMENIII